MAGLKLAGSFSVHFCQGRLLFFSRGLMIAVFKSGDTTPEPTEVLMVLVISWVPSSVKFFAHLFLSLMQETYYFVTYLCKKQLWFFCHLWTEFNKNLDKFTQLDQAAIPVTDFLGLAMREKKADKGTVVVIVANCCSSETVHHVGSSVVSLLLHPEAKSPANQKLKKWLHRQMNV